jgi:DNA-binding transcriptional regulator YhcF (GntR family)
MLLSIEPDGPVPIYQQIRDRIVEAIADGRQPAGSALPSIRELAVDLGVNFHTVNKGYDLLRQEGLLRLGRKSGAVVRRDAGSGPPDPGWAQDWAGRLRTLLAEATARGCRPRASPVNARLPWRISPSPPRWRRRGTEAEARHERGEPGSGFPRAGRWGADVPGTRGEPADGAVRGPRSP